MLIMGIDIGTTTISLILMNTETGELTDRRTIEHGSFIEGRHSKSREQDPERILKLAIAGMEELIAANEKPCGIGLTGQMHGMLYVDRDGKAVSPLYTWQDGSGDLPLTIAGEEAPISSAAWLGAKVGNGATGFGVTTHFYLQHTGNIPENAVKMVTISDYLAMRLCGNAEPVLAADMAASWGCFDLENGCFPEEKLRIAGVDTSYLPKVVSGHPVVGKTKDGIPVTASLGDNQASVIGSVQDLEHTVLINVGTGSQVSFGTGKYLPSTGSIELRPCTETSYIMAGSSLCGGRAYAMLEQFYKELYTDLTGTQAPEHLYGVMGTQAERFLETSGKDAAWEIVTTFSGTRSNPLQKGAIGNIGANNFHPGALTAGMILGILQELNGYYQEMCQMTGQKATYLVGSGNGIRKNALMQRLAEEMFGLPMQIPVCQEEAACGAALSAMAETGLAADLSTAQKLIQYL